MDVLRALEETAWHIEPEEIEEIRRKQNWKFWQDINPEVFTVDGDISADMLFRLTSHAHHAKTMVDTLLALLDTALDIQEQLEGMIRLKPKPIVMNPSKGILSLPDELLGHILVSSVSLHDRKQAIRLSHVSRRFRMVALAEPSLWGTINFDAREREFDAFLARSGQNSDLHIVIRESNRRTEIQSMLEKCWPVTSRWKSLTVIQQHGVKRFNLRTFIKADDIFKMMDGNRRLHLERLEDLQVTDHPTSNRIAALFEPDSDSETFIPSWTAPNLRSLRFKDYVPSPAPVFASVTSLAFSTRVFQNTFERRISRLLSFLAATPSITELNLVTEHDTSFMGRAGGNFQPQDVSCPSITSINLHLSNFGIERQAIHFVSTFMRVLRVPKLQHLSVSIGFRYKEMMMSPGLGGYAGYELLRDLSNALLPSGHSRSQLTSLTYKFELDASHLDLNGVAQNVSARRRTFTIPLDRVPNVSSITLTTFTQIRFSCNNSSVPCHLRELHLRECNEMDRGSLEETIESLEDAGAWDTVESVTVENCNALQYETASDVIGPERLLFLET